MVPQQEDEQNQRGILLYKVFISGLSTGLLLQLAIGPVFFFILNTSLQRTVMDGLFSVLAVTIVDYLYITLAVFGVGKLLEKQKVKKILGFISSLVLIIFGVMMLFSIGKMLGNHVMEGPVTSDYLSSFLSAFFLTVSSPLTILFWTSLFATKAIENSYTRKQLIVFGVSAGFATLSFLGSAVIVFSLLKSSIPLILVRTLNLIVGFILIIYGIMRFAKVSKDVI